MSDVSWSYVELDLSSEFECSFIVVQVGAVDADSGCSNISEQDGGIFVWNRQVQFAADSHFGHMVSLSVVMLDNKQSFLKWSLSVDVEDTLNINKSTSSPY